jgi:hypothetical protein
LLCNFISPFFFVPFFNRTHEMIPCKRGNVWSSCLVHFIAFQIIPRISNPLFVQNLPIRTEILTDKLFARRGPIVPC